MNQRAAAPVGCERLLLVLPPAPCDSDLESLTTVAAKLISADSVSVLQRGRGDSTLAGNVAGMTVVRSVRDLAGWIGRRRTATAVACFGVRGNALNIFAAIVIGRRACLIVNEHGDAFWLALSPVVSHVKHRLATRFNRARHRAASGRAMLRTHGPSATWRHLREQSRPRTLPRSRPRLPFAPITFQPTERPSVSIVIPAHNHWETTAECLRSIADERSETAYEVILVDDGSQDRTAAAATSIKGLRVVRLSDNAGFVAACNAGAAAARGNLLCFLNNDTLVTRGWLDELARTIERGPDVGVVGAKLVFASGALQEAGGIVFRDGTAWNYGRGDDPNLPRYCFARDVDYCSGAAFLVRRELYLAAGGFDREFEPGYWEDTDLCFKARALGWRVVYQAAATVVHHEGVSAGRDITQGMKRHQVANARRFARRWRRALTRQCPSGTEHIVDASDRRNGARILVIDHHVPTPDRDAGSLFLWRMLCSLSAAGFRPVFWPDNRSLLGTYGADLQRRGIEVECDPGTLLRLMRQQRGRFDAVVVHRPELVTKHHPTLLESGVPLGYIAPDLAYRRLRRKADLGLCPHTAADEALVAERRVVKAARAMATHNPAEVEFFKHEFGARALHIPLPVSISAAPRRDFDLRCGFLFVGSRHDPNADALRHLANEIWPLLTRRLPGACLFVAGQVCDFVPKLDRLPGVQVLGIVDSLRASMETARVLLAPLRYGAGVKGKVIEALGAGLPAVVTPVGAEGTPLESGRGGAVAATDAEFVRHAVRLHESPCLWRAASVAGRRAVRDSHGPEAFDSALLHFIESISPTAGSSERPRRASRHGSH